MSSFHVGIERVPLYTEVSSFQVGIEGVHCIQRCPHFRLELRGSTVYRGVLISGWNRGGPLCPHFRLEYKGLHCIQVFSSGKFYSRNSGSTGLKIASWYNVYRNYFMQAFLE